ncbi:PTS glucose transporter subunit IIA [Lachnospiraceae bacterium 54-53]
MIHLFKKKPMITPEKNCVYAPVSGEAKPLSKVSDQMFSKELMGKGIAIEPDSDTIYAPVSGRVTAAPGSRHAVAVTSSDGVEILVHVGINTVDLNGEYFKGYVSKGEEVQAGQKLIEFDRKRIIAAGYDVITPVIVANTDDYEEVLTVSGRHVSEMEKVIEVK